MKIAFLFDGDNAVFGTPWIGYFAGRGHETHWISLPPIRDKVPAGVHTHSFNRDPGSLFSAVQASRWVRRLLKEISPQLLHVHSVGTYGLVASLTRFQPLVSTAWGSDVLIAGKHWLKGPLVRYALHRSQLITCDAEHMRRAMQGMGVGAEKIHIINFGTDTDLYRPRSHNMPLRKKLGIGDRPVVTSFRSLRPLYDVETLIRAVPRVLKRVPQTFFVIAGGGSERERLSELATALGMAESVRFVGFIRPESIPEYQAMADVYVSTSLSDAGIAASTSEAMSSGVPVVVSDTAENRLWIKEDEGGYLFPAKDDGALAEKVVLLLEDEEARKRFGAHNRSVIEARNNYVVEMGKMEQLCHEVIERHGKA